jgi:hypothetical protein
MPKQDTHPPPMPPMVVDRSPELLRFAVPQGTHLAVPVTQKYSFIVSPMEGTPGDPEDCPVALAIRRLFVVKEMHLDGQRPYFITDDGVVHPLALPADIALWIGRFDRREPVMPFEMTLEMGPAVPGLKP